MCREIDDARNAAMEIRTELNLLDVVNLDTVVNYIEEKLDCDIKIIRFNFDFLAKKINNDRFSKAGAYVIKENDQYTIALNSKNDLVFQRFSMAHELGHIILNHLNSKNSFISFQIEYNVSTIDIERCKNNEYYMKEQCANVFALELLIPKLPTSAGNSRDLIDFYANKYNVSHHAIIAKLDNQKSS